MTDLAAIADEESPQAERNELGKITIADKVVAKIAAQAAGENPDAGAAAARLLGVALPGAGHLGLRASDLDALPKTSADVDGSLVVLSMELSVRWPAAVREVTDQVRSHIRDRVRDLTGLTVQEVRIVVAALVTDITPPPRVR